MPAVPGHRPCVSDMATVTLCKCAALKVGRFVCSNCCSEEFQGNELASPRYSWKDFYNEPEWNVLNLTEPKHHPEARKRQYAMRPAT